MSTALSHAKLGYMSTIHKAIRIVIMVSALFFFKRIKCHF